MTVYVDAIRGHYVGNKSSQVQRNGSQWCHLWSDSNDLEDLHKMALDIGLKRLWFQPDSSHEGTIYHLPHYDLVPSKRKKAIALGVIEREVTELFKQRRENKNLGE